MNVASARGRSAEYFGPGPSNANVQNDITVRTEDIPNRAQSWLDTGGDEQAAIIQAFTDGANEYAQRHADTIDPLFRRVLPIVPTDITAGIQNVIHFRFMPSQDLIPDSISAWKSGGASAANAGVRPHSGLLAQHCARAPASLRRLKWLGDCPPKKRVGQHHSHG